ncbi:putative ATPase [Actinoplanes couchii]|nr:putative ATPase [Actinoplanes couchii]
MYTVGNYALSHVHRATQGGVPFFVERVVSSRYVFSEP